MPSIRNRFIRKVAILMAPLTMASAVMLAAPNTAAADTIDTVTSSEVAAALSGTESGNGDLVAEPVKSAVDSDSAAVVTKNGMTTDVPKDPEDGVSLGADGAPSVIIGLPNADEAKDAQRTDDGSIIYAGTDGSAQAVIPTASGAQVLTTIANADAPTRYTYDVTVPDGGKVELTDNGEAVVFDGSGAVMLVAPVPWAEDSKGNAVPTHYETDGKSLTQVVEHNTGNYAYPVVADPSFWGFVGCILGTGLPIGLAIAVAYAPNTWGAMFSVLRAMNMQPMNATRYTNMVWGWCRKAIW